MFNTMGNTMGNTMANKLHNDCSHRLPCGYCVLLGRDCPRQTAYVANLASSGDSTSRAAFNKPED